ncbi:hypothetical protein EGT07_25020 [Herbaspirillum sp. HC18]|nr:hypothetical protein EGT07_25020 [Herbaspirillum sp. HC18]
MMAMLVKGNPRMLAMAKQQELFPEVERIVVALIANAVSPGDAFLTYEKYGSLVPDWKFVFASEKGPIPGFAVNRSFSDGSVVRGLFASERVVVLDPDMRRAMLAKREVTFPIDYSIALDTQALSYLAPYIDGKTTKLPKDFHEIFAFISQENVFVDPIPYLTENLPNVLIEKNIPGIRRRLAAYEILRTIDGTHFHETQEIRSTIPQDERNGNVDRFIDKMIKDASNPKLMSSVLHRHTLAYCMLLKMTTIQLRSRDKSKATKLHELVEFMDTQLQTMFAREIVVAAEYFDKGQNLTFFGKIQKAPSDHLPELIAQLKNMAWDFFHIRYIEGAVTNDDTLLETSPDQARYFFPALLTCDKRFIEVIDLYPLKSCAYQQGTQRPVPFPAIDWITIAAGTPDAEAEFMNRYFSRQVLHRRETHRDHVESNLLAIVRDLEEEFAKATQQH